MAENFNGVIGIVFQRSNPIKFVLIHNKKTGNITFPAGGREFFETSSIKTLARELKEETGLLPLEYKIMKTPLVHEFVYNLKKKERCGQKARQHVYLVETKKTDLKPEDPDSIIYGWLTKEEILERLTFSDSKEIFKKAVEFL